MTDKYQPTLKEIVCEMKNGLVPSSIRKLGISLVKILKHVGLMSVGGTLVVNSCGYLVPTILRFFDECKDDGPFPSLNPYEEMTALGLSLIITVPSAGLSGVYHISVYLKNPKYLAIPLTTNAISLVYETYREAKQRLIEKTDSLDDRLV